VNTALFGNHEPVHPPGDRLEMSRISGAAFVAIIGQATRRPDP
jgi:hypothetical protein